jgi:hypothetical protein
METEDSGFAKRDRLEASTVIYVSNINGLTKNLARNLTAPAAGWERTPRNATQRAAWEALTKAEEG